MNKVKFGKKIVEIKTKKELVKSLFNKVSNQYDLMNDLMSFGLHRLWKKDLIQNIDVLKPSLILDLRKKNQFLEMIFYQIFYSWKAILAFYSQHLSRPC